MLLDTRAPSLVIVEGVVLAAGTAWAADNSPAAAVVLAGSKVAVRKLLEEAVEVRHTVVHHTAVRCSSCWPT